MSRFTQKLENLRTLGRYRALRLPHGLDLSSNDYLGIAHDNLLKEHAYALLDANTPTGASGPRLLRGNQEAHESLEHAAAKFFGHEAALYFATGFQGNYAIFSTLCTRHDVVIYDEFLHASARDGIAASPAKTKRIKHNDLQGFESALQEAAKNRRTGGEIWLAVESLYSMDGDQAPLQELYAMAQQYGAILIVDEAHATGVLGQDGRGLSYGMNDNVIVLHACGKALGVAGALMCASQDIIDYMMNMARPFVFSTAPMPLQAALVEKALEIVASAEGEKRRKALLDLHDGQYIIPLILGEDLRAVKVAEAIQAQGYDIRAVRPPTVPEGTARLRLSLSAAVDKVTLAQFMEAYQLCKKSL